ncbi:MAG: VCBS repeat-containing protein, partial [Candidatus Latescibacterota bacterium]|nr:VCBS repeat-containing protein [Candidatus Latescibacterota bacterium]
MSRRFSLTLSLVLLVWGCGEDESAVPASSPDYATPARPSYARGSAPAKVPVIPFEEVAAEAGIDFVHTNGAFGDKWMPETMGSGVAFDDLDADGDADIVLVNGTWWPGHEGEGSVPTSAVFANDGAGYFTDVTPRSGLDVPVQGMGITAADYDADGDKDLFVTTLGANLLLRQKSAW